MRESAINLNHDISVSPRVIKTIDFLLKEREPFKRQGYPRAGAFDRLIIIALWQENINLCGKIWLPAPRVIITKNIICLGHLTSILPPYDYDSNILVIIGYQSYPGMIKYGNQNKLFSQTEMGIFLQALHVELCNNGISNHLQGGINLTQLNKLFQLPLDIDMNEILGLLA